MIGMQLCFLSTIIYNLNFKFRCMPGMPSSHPLHILIYLHTYLRLFNDLGD